MIDYAQWLDEYEENAFQVLVAIEKKKKQLDQETSNVNAERIREAIKMWQEVYREQLAVVRWLSRKVIKL
jgi:thiaminase